MANKIKYRVPKNPYAGFANVFEQSVIIAGKRKLRQFAENYTKDIIKIIENQEYAWKPLSAKYLQSKIDKGLDTRIYIATGEFKNNIGWDILPNGDVTFGLLNPNKIHSQTANKKRPLTMRELARIHEFGTERTPARPIWRPTIAKHRAMISQTKREIINDAKQIVVKEMKSRGITIK